MLVWSTIDHPQRTSLYDCLCTIEIPNSIPQTQRWIEMKENSYKFILTPPPPNVFSCSHFLKSRLSKLSSKIKSPEQIVPKANFYVNSIVDLISHGSFTWCLTPWCCGSTWKTRLFDSIAMIYHGTQNQQWQHFLFLAIHRIDRSSTQTNVSSNVSFQYYGKLNDWPLFIY